MGGGGDIRNARTFLPGGQKKKKWGDDKAETLARSGHLHDALEEELGGRPQLVGEEGRGHSGHHLQHSQQADGDLEAGRADLHLPPLQHHVVRPQRHLLDLRPG